MPGWYVSFSLSLKGRDDFYSFAHPQGLAEQLMCEYSLNERIKPQALYIRAPEPGSIPSGRRTRYSQRCANIGTKSVDWGDSLAAHVRLGRRDFTIQGVGSILDWGTKISSKLCGKAKLNKSMD